MLPKNAQGDPEYASIVLTLDGSPPHDGEHIIQKSVKSTQTPEESVVALFHYYNEGALSLRGDHLDMLHKGAQTDTVYMYTPPTKRGIVQIVIGSGAYRTLIDHKDFGRGSNFVADQKLIEVLARAAQAAEKQRGATPALLMIQVGEEAIADVAAATIQPAV